MWPFSDCTLDIVYEQPPRPGQPFTGQVVVRAKRAIFADRGLLLTFTVAFPGTASTGEMVLHRSDTPLPNPIKRELERGEHRFPFEIQIPIDVPPTLVGTQQMLRSTLKVSLDVGFAFGESKSFDMPIVGARAQRKGRPLLCRSSSDHPDTPAFEIALDNSVVVEGNALVGTIAMVAGETTRFRQCSISYLYKMWFIIDGQKVLGERHSLAQPVDDDRLRRGHTVRFEIPGHAADAHAVAREYMQHSVFLALHIDDHVEAIPIEMVARGSTVEPPPPRERSLADERRLEWRDIATKVGLTVSDAALEVRGQFGVVELTLSDSRRIAAEVVAEFAFPSLGVGLVAKKKELLSGNFAKALPPDAVGSFSLSVDPVGTRPAPAPEVLAPWVDAALGKLPVHQFVRMTDTELSLRFLVHDPATEDRLAIANECRRRADAMDAALRSLPFPTQWASSRPHWEQAAALRGAVLVATGPSLQRLKLSAVLVDGQRREVEAGISTRWNGGEVQTHVDVDLQHAPISLGAVVELETGDEGLREVVKRLPLISWRGRNRVRLARVGFVEDPRELLPALDAFFRWVLHTRNEAVADTSSPYR